MALSSGLIDRAPAEDAPHSRSAARPEARPLAAALTWLFLILVALPIVFTIGPMRLSPYRIMLLLAMLPLMALWLSQAFNGIKLPDVLALAFCVWATVALVANHPVTEIWETSGILLADCFGAYLLGRC